MIGAGFLFLLRWQTIFSRGFIPVYFSIGWMGSDDVQALEPDSAGDRSRPLACPSPAAARRHASTWRLIVNE